MFLNTIYKKEIQRYQFNKCSLTLMMHFLYDFQYFIKYIGERKLLKEWFQEIKKNNIKSSERSHKHLSKEIATHRKMTS